MRAKDGILEATLAYATRAKQKGDYDLGLSLLDANIPQHQPLLTEILAAKRDRDARQQRLKTARRIGVALLATIVVVVTVAFFMVQAEKNKTQAALVQAKSPKPRPSTPRPMRSARRKTPIASGKPPTRPKSRQWLRRKRPIANEKRPTRPRSRPWPRSERPKTPRRPKNTGPMWPASAWPPPRSKRTPSTGPAPSCRSVPRAAKLGMGTIGLSLRPGRSRCPHGRAD